MILTTDEKDKIIKNDKKREEPIINSESDIVSYKLNDKPEHHYICPKYWCMKTNTPMTKEEIEAGNCKNDGDKKTKTNINDVLISDTGNVSDKMYVYDFYKSNESLYPGFSKNNTKPGLCIPCCFKKWNTPTRIKMREECSDKKKIIKSSNKPIDDTYIIASEKLTVDADRWAFVPNIIQQIFNRPFNQLQDSSLQKNMSDLMRRGVEYHKNQSFVACIANILFFGLIDPIPSIVEMKEKIRKAITLDSFMTYQNGNLIESFQTGDNTSNISEYNTSTIFKKAEKTNRLTFVLKRTISAYENFLDYLEDDTIEIDYKWLWDIITTPNDKLFKNGINLVIFDISKNANDTDKISIICPSNVYSNNKYDPNLKTCFILKQDRHFTPIYYIVKADHDTSVSKTFYEKKSTTPNFISEFIINIAKPILETECNAKEDRQYTNTELISIMKKTKYTDIIQVLNFQGKVVGVHAKKNNICGMIPCYPSAIIDNLDFVYIDDVSISHTYAITLEFILGFYKDDKIISKIVDDKQSVVGFLVNNQFIKLSEEIDLSETSNDFLNEIITKDVSIGYEIDDQMTDRNHKDSEREKLINTIRLETSMYKYFRNTLRILLNDYKNISERNQIISIIQNDVLYSDQMKKINKIVKKLMEPHIFFVEENIEMLKNLINSNRLHNDIDTNNPEESCIYTHINKDNKKACGIVISKTNLITHKNNDEVYFNRISDEFLRFNHVKQFLLTPYTYQMFENVSTNIHDNEMIVFGNTISQDDIFSNLIPIKSTSYENPRPFDIVRPFSTAKVRDKFELDIKEKETENKKLSCVFNSTPIEIAQTKWKNRFPKTYRQISYYKTNDCGWKFMIDIINKYKQLNIDKNTLVDILVTKYSDITDKFENPTLMSKLSHMFNIDGHRTMNILNNVDINLFIIEDTYNVTTIDMWILLEHYEIPSMILFEPKVVINTYKHELIIPYKPPDFLLTIETLKNDTSFEWLYVSTPVFEQNRIKYKYIVNTPINSKVTRLPSSFKNGIIPDINFDTFFNMYTKPKRQFKTIDFNNFEIQKSKKSKMIDLSSSKIQK